MCGLVGIIGKNKAGLFQTDATIFSQMLFADQLRGVDGTGIICNDSKGIHVLKSPVRADNLMYQKSYEDAMDAASKEGHFLLGHNRASTRGKNVWRNTHPFKEGNIILMHNGTLHEHKSLAENTEVDSHAICKHMAIHGAEDTISKIDGAFALIWVDLATLTINLVRNTERPLILTETAGHWVISSEKGLANWILDRNGRTVKEQMMLPSGIIHTFDLKDAKEYTTKIVELRKAPVQVYDMDKYRNWQNEYWKDEDKKDADGVSQETCVLTAGDKRPEPRRFGEIVMCKPVPLDGQVKDSAIVFDDKRNANFVLCKVYNEPDTEVRVYGKYKHLVSLCYAGLIQGHVDTTVFKGKKTIYHLRDAFAHKTKGELAVVAQKKELVMCECCACEVDSDDIVEKHNVKMCPVCAASIGVWVN